VATFRLLADYGGSAVVGAVEALDTAMFWKGYRR
jgi:hypothetical protein